MEKTAWGADFQSRLEARLAAEEEHPLPRTWRAVLTVMSAVYYGLYSADRLSYRLGLRRSVHPGIPVVGLGNLVAGGTGKTPCVIRLANGLRREGLRPAIVSHGYRGRAVAPLVVSNGSMPIPPLPAEAGDEARLAALSCPGIPVVAGRDRVAAAELAREQFDPEVLLVDDAFQHWRLARDLDLVLLDATKPFGNGRLLPRGWLREPITALARADAVILVGQPMTSTGLQLPAPIFQAVLAPVSLTPWEDWRRGIRRPADRERPGRAAAFCGLARPARFRATLEGLGWTITDWLVTPDHELPEADSFHRWAEGKQGPVLTTEKDAVKLTAELAGILAGMGRELWVLGMEFRPREEEALLSFVRKGIAAAVARWGICDVNRI